MYNRYVMSEIIYRNAEVRDALQMQELNLRTLPENYPLSLWTEILSMMSSFIFVAVHNDVIIGYSAGIIQFSEEGVVGTIMSLAVDEDYRNKNVGNTCLQKSLVALSDTTINKITLCVRESHLVAQHIYQKNGFEMSHVIDDYYDAPKERGLFMVLE